ncbi:hypothetical protein LMG1861_02099 [Achromobacter piechaudii]|uniref:Fimbrial-type adhesion domain-containing protein n=2 Tax=Achromobacter piechaudii TaxID=72556 RepID=A0A6S7D234_9BURK|nr:hypothetical protein LMG1861_02099 [Achromobacter piechaudii]
MPRTTACRLPFRPLAMAISALLLTGVLASDAIAQPAPHDQAPRSLPNIAPAGCMVVLGQPTVDYGHFTAGQLNRDTAHRYELERRSVPLTVNCPTARAIALRVSGPARHDGAVRFAGAGAVGIVLRNVRVDGDETRIQNPDSPQGPQAQLTLRPGDTVVLEHRRVGRNLTAQIDVNPEVTDADVRVNDQTVWSAVVQFELVNP